MSGKAYSPTTFSLSLTSRWQRDALKEKIRLFFYFRIAYGDSIWNIMNQNAIRLLQRWTTTANQFFETPLDLPGNFPVSDIGKPLAKSLKPDISAHDSRSALSLRHFIFWAIRVSEFQKNFKKKFWLHNTQVRNANSVTKLIQTSGYHLAS